MPNQKPQPLTTMANAVEISKANGWNTLADITAKCKNKREIKAARREYYFHAKNNGLMIPPKYPRRVWVLSMLRSLAWYRKMIGSKNGLLGKGQFYTDTRAQFEHFRQLIRGAVFNERTKTVLFS